MRVPRLALPAALLVALAGCGDGGGPGAASPTTGAPSSSGAAVPVSVRADLTARAAAAQDRYGISFYSWTPPGEDADPRTVMVVRAEDGSTRVDIPGGALGGTVDVSIVTTADGQLHHCTLPPEGEPAPELPPGCVAVDELRAEHDPKVQHVFTDWLEVLLDPSAPLAVTPGTPPEGSVDVDGTCFQVEVSTASLLAPLDTGVYCFGPDGTLTGASLSLGTVTRAGGDETVPPSVDLPAPVVEAEPAPLASPTPTPTPTPTPRSDRER